MGIVKETTDGCSIMGCFMFIVFICILAEMSGCMKGM